MLHLRDYCSDWPDCSKRQVKRTLLMDFPSTWWRHHMKTFSALLAICAGNSPVTVEFLAQSLGPVTRSFEGFFYLRMNNDWENNDEAGDLRRHRAHYDVTVMMFSMSSHRYKGGYTAHWSKVTYVFVSTWPALVHPIDCRLILPSHKMLYYKFIVLYE